MKNKTQNSAAVDTATIDTKRQYAPVSIFRIIFSMIYDSLLLAAMGIGYSAIAVAIHVIIYGAPPEHERIHWHLMESIVYCVGLSIVLMSYFIYSWRRTGQTLGMKTWRIMVIDENSHQTLSNRAAFVRALTAVISFSLLGLGYWLRWLHPQKRTWHDLASKSQVILLKKN